MILGSGLEPREFEPDHFKLSIASTERVVTAAMYSTEHKLGAGALLLCAGGSSPLYDGLGNNPDEESEGFKMREQLAHLNVSSDVTVLAETRSNSTMANFVNSIEAGLLVPADYSHEFPLGIVAHRHHFMRARIDARRAGFDRHSLLGIHPDQYMEYPRGQDGLLHNLGGIALSTVAYMGVKRGDLRELTHRNDITMGLLSRVAALKK